jgi:hypothetical protein
MKNELKKEEISATPALADLTEEQISSIVNLSTVVVDRTTKGIYDSIDSDMAPILGEKPAGIKTLAWVSSSVANALDKTKDIETLKQRVSTLQQEKDAMGKKAGLGESEEINRLKKVLKDKEDELKTIKSDYEGKFNTLKEEADKSASKVVGLHIDNNINKKLSDLKFTVPDSVAQECS